MIDNTFTSASTDQTNVDCISGSTSNALSGGKYGCNTGSASLVTPRFRVDHYAVTNTMSDTCNGGGTTSVYMGQGVAAVNVTARNADSGQMTRLLSGAATYYATNYPAVTFPTITLTNDGAAWSPSSSTIHFTAPAWPAATPGGYYDANTNSPTCTATFCPYFRSPTSKTAPVSLKLRVQITDSDAGTANIKDINGAAVQYAYPNNTNAAISFRHGMLKLDNVYGSELLPAYVPITALYWNGGGWQRNTDDSCTRIYRSNIGLNGTIPASLSGSVNILSPASASYITLLNGQGSMKFNQTGTGNVGSVDIAINLGNGTAQDASCVSAARKQAAYAGAGMTWLQGTWCNAAAYSQDPSARVTFGSAKSPFLYRREKY